MDFYLFIKTAYIFFLFLGKNQSIQKSIRLKLVFPPRARRLEDAVTSKQKMREQSGRSLSLSLQQFSRKNTYDPAAIKMCGVNICNRTS